MTAATGSPVAQESGDYLASVQAELADLPAEDRSALLEDLALHLEALAVEDDDRPLAVRLGSPSAYAADLRAAAGLPTRQDGSSTEPVRLRERLARLPLAPALREVRRLLVELRPAWWVARGYLLVAVPSVLQVDGTPDFPVPAPWDSRVLGLLLVAAAVTGSVALGRRSMGRPLRLLVGGAGVALLAASFVVWQWAGVTLGTASGGVGVAGVADQQLETYPLVSRSGPVTDVFPYAADGTPLEGVLLYDQDGRPLRVGFQEWWEDRCVRVLEQPLAADGVAVPNSYPQSYELLGLDVDIHSAPITPGQCATSLPRPDVPLPTFEARSAAPAPGD